MNRNEMIDEGFKLLQLLQERETTYAKAFDVIERTIADVTHEFTHGLQCIDGKLRDALLDHIDWLFGVPGTSTCSYLLDECSTWEDGGIITEEDGTEFKLRTLNDLRAYIEHVNKEPA